jgi:hypothetical protein
MAGQNHEVNLAVNAKSLAVEVEGAALLGSARFWFMILSGHDSVIYRRLDSPTSGFSGIGRRDLAHGTRLY